MRPESELQRALGAAQQALQRSKEETSRSIGDALAFGTEFGRGSTTRLLEDREDMKRLEGIVEALKWVNGEAILNIIGSNKDHIGGQTTLWLNK